MGGKTSSLIPFALLLFAACSPTLRFTTVSTAPVKVLEATVVGPESAEAAEVLIRGRAVAACGGLVPRVETIVWEPSNAASAWNAAKLRVTCEPKDAAQKANEVRLRMQAERREIVVRDALKACQTPSHHDCYANAELVAHESPGEPSLLSMYESSCPADATDVSVLGCRRAASMRIQADEDPVPFLRRGCEHHDGISCVNLFTILKAASQVEAARVIQRLAERDLFLDCATGKEEECDGLRRLSDMCFSVDLECKELKARTKKHFAALAADEERRRQLSDLAEAARDNVRLQAEALRRQEEIAQESLRLQERTTAAQEQLARESRSRQLEAAFAPLTRPTVRTTCHAMGSYLTCDTR
jgi:hypothetical protein